MRFPTKPRHYNGYAIVRVWGVNGTMRSLDLKDKLTTTIKNAVNSKKDFPDTDFEYIEILFPQESFEREGLFVEMGVYNTSMQNAASNEEDFAYRLQNTLAKEAEVGVVCIVSVSNFYRRLVRGMK